MGRIVVDKYNIIRDEPLIVSVASPYLNLKFNLFRCLKKRSRLALSIGQPSHKCLRVSEVVGHPRQMLDRVP
jgi:hypothetical protein